MALSEFYFAIFNDEKWSLDSTSVSKEPHFFIADVSDNGQFRWNLGSSAEVLNVSYEIIGTLMNSDPSSIDKDFDALSICNGLLVDNRKRFNSKVLENRDKLRGT